MACLSLLVAAPAVDGSTRVPAKAVVQPDRDAQDLVVRLRQLDLVDLVRVVDVVLAEAQSALVLLPRAVQLVVHAEQRNIVSRCDVVERVVLRVSVEQRFLHLLRRALDLVFLYRPVTAVLVLTPDVQFLLPVDRDRVSVPRSNLDVISPQKLADIERHLLEVHLLGDPQLGDITPAPRPQFVVI